MVNYPVLISSAAPSAVLLLSVYGCYIYLLQHTSLAPDAQAHAAVLQRFDSEAERASFYEQQRRALQRRVEAARATYRATLLRELEAWDPKPAKPYLDALVASANSLR